MAAGSRARGTARSASSGTRSSAKKAPAKKAVVKKAPAKATPAKTAPAKKAAAKAMPAKKAPAKKAAVKKAPAKKAAAANASARKTATAKAPARAATKRTTATSTAATKTPAKRAPSRKAPAKKAPAKRPAYRADETPWTAAELKAVRDELLDDVARLREEIRGAEEDLEELTQDGVDAGGDDPVDVGAKAFEREQGMFLAGNTREILRQSRHALERIDEGTYGVCESCGEPIGKARLQAFPRATLCVRCKEAQERL